MTKSKILITGTGRAGTTFLTQLFTALGFDTGYNHPTAYIWNPCNAGYERLLEDYSNFEQIIQPRILKSPYFCVGGIEKFKNKGIDIEHIIIPIRKLSDAAKSRITHGNKPGGLWDATAQNQEQKLAEKLGRLFASLTLYNIPYTTMIFPKLVEDAHYTFNCLKPVLTNISLERFLKAFEELADLSKVHFK
jgi:hypothetical protein